MKLYILQETASSAFIYILYVWKFCHNCGNIKLTFGRERHYLNFTLSVRSMLEFLMLYYKLLFASLNWYSKGDRRVSSNFKIQYSVWIKWSSLIQTTCTNWCPKEDDPEKPKCGNIRWEQSSPPIET